MADLFSMFSLGEFQGKSPPHFGDAEIALDEK
jgi:hypothetical protein